MSTLTSPLPAPRHANAQTSAGLLHYVEAGAGTPIVLIHGGHGGWVHWMANLDGLARRHRVLALDMPGFGQSYTPAERPDLDGYAEAASQFLDTLGLHRVAVAGFSFGTFVAAKLALKRPDAVDSVTLVNPPGIGERSAAALALSDRLSAIAREHGLAAGVTATLTELMLRDAGLIDAALVETIVQAVRQTRHKTRGLSRQSQMLPLLAQLTQKTQILIGAHDPYQGYKLAERIAAIQAANANIGVRVIEACAHWLQYERADAFNGALLDFASPISLRSSNP
jgi:pimeloyl-ACP methyl ester carboxylesterase